MSSIFTKIIKGEIPSYTIAETEHCYAFLDIRPLQEGHTLVIPKMEVDYIYDLDDDLLSELMLFSKKIARAIKVVIPCNRIGVTVIGLEVPHAHIHLVPMQNMGDMNFSNPPVDISTERYEAIATQIANQYKLLT